MKKIKVCLLFIVNNNMINDYENLGICYIASVMRQYGCVVLVKTYTIENIDYNEIIKFNPHILGFSTYFNNIKDIHQIIDTYKRKIPEVIVFVGGPHVTLYGNEIMQHNVDIEFGIKGEGEKTVIHLLNAIYGNKEYGTIQGLNLS